MVQESIIPLTMRLVIEDIYWKYERDIIKPIQTVEVLSSLSNSGETSRVALARYVPYLWIFFFLIWSGQWLQEVRRSLLWFRLLPVLSVSPYSLWVLILCLRGEINNALIPTFPCISCFFTGEGEAWSTIVTCSGVDSGLVTLWLILCLKGWVFVGSP